MLTTPYIFLLDEESQYNIRTTEMLITAWENSENFARMKPQLAVPVGVEARMCKSAHNGLHLLLTANVVQVS